MILPVELMVWVSIRTYALVRQEIEEVARALKKDRGRSRVLVYSSYVNECEYLAEQVLECQCYHARLSSEGRHHALQDWLASGHRVLVGTNAFGTGVDFPNVRCVIHYGRPHGLVDFLQESGRAGRAGEFVKSIVLITEPQLASRRSGIDVKDADQQALIDYLTTRTCRRQVLSRLMDAQDAPVCGEGQLPCNHCRAPPDPSSTIKVVSSDPAGPFLPRKTARLFNSQVISAIEEL